MQVQTMIEQLLFVTVRISTIAHDGTLGSGTGFFFEEDLGNGRSAILLVTNKHVVAGASTVLLHFVGAADGQPVLGVERRVEAHPSLFHGHPDPDIDITVLGIAGMLEQLQQAGTPVFFRSVSASMCATPQLLDNYEPIEPVTFIGYPSGLFDSASLLPIVRQGHAATALNVDYEGKATFLIDGSVFPGSSGSPVFLVPKPSAPDKRGNIVIGGAPRPPVLLGVVAAVHQRQVPVLQAHAAAGVPFVFDLIDLGVVYKAREIVTLVNELVAGLKPVQDPE